jgi:hypothetical protein
MLFAAALLTAGQVAAADKAGRYGANPENLEPHLKRLVEAYPGVVKGYDKDALILANGKRLPLSDGRTDKTSTRCSTGPTSATCSPSAIPPARTGRAAALNHDPGRIRVEALFEALYGDCRKGEVAAKLRKVKWLPGHGGGTVMLTEAQGAADALERVSRELDALPASFVKYLVPSGGTYNCRVIAGTDRMSMHAYGAAIDINTKHTTYWQWVKPGPDGTYRWSNQIPAEIVDIFEKHGFIWGGRWYHFDTMHFEYRPELAIPRK